MDSEIDKLTAAGRNILPGDVAFVLYDTFGFPLELTEEMCEERGITIDKEGFEAAMGIAARARPGLQQADQQRHLENVYTELADKIAPSPFCGYTKTKCEAQVKAIIVDGALAESAAAGTEADLVLSEYTLLRRKGRPGGRHRNA